MKNFEAYLEEKFKTLTPKQIAYVLSSDIRDHFMLYGVNVTLYLDPSLTLMNLWRIDGCERVFASKYSVVEECQRIFISNASANANAARYVVSHKNAEGVCTYTQGLRGVGQDFGWRSTFFIEEAEWFDSLEAVMDHIRRYGLECSPAIIEQVKVHKIYLDLTGKYLC